MMKKYVENVYMAHVSHKYQAIFFHVPKTAGRFIVNDVLTKHYGFERHPILPKFWNPDEGTIQYFQKRLHLLNLTPEKWNKYFKFAFVRDPYDRAISGWAFTKKDHNLSFIDYMNLDMKHKNRNCVWHQDMPQYQHLINLDGEIGVNFIGRFEFLEEDLKTILTKHLHIPEDKIKHNCQFKRNSSQHDYYLKYYEDPKLINLVKERFSRDFQIKHELQPNDGY